MNFKINHWVGGGLTILGILLLLAKFQVFPQSFQLMMSESFIDWRLLFIIFGIVLLGFKRTIGWIFVIGGISVYLIQSSGGNQFEWVYVIAIVSLIGYLQWRKFKYKSNDRFKIHQYINEVSIFSDTEKRITTDNFKGGKLTAVFGGSEVSLLDVDLIEEKAEIDVFFLFGGSVLILPNDWKIESKELSILSGFKDRRLNVVYKPNHSKTLIIRGFMMFGGLEISSTKQIIDRQ